MTSEATTLIAGYLILINLAAFAAFLWDKSAAEEGGWRVSEQSLLMLAFIGGSAGAVAGQKILRHKTRKQPFRKFLRLIVGIHGLLLAGLAYNWLLMLGLL